MQVREIKQQLSRMRGRPKQVQAWMIEDIIRQYPASQRYQVMQSIKMLIHKDKELHHLVTQSFHEGVLEGSI